MAEITMKHVKDYFNEGTSRPVSTSEFAAFWKACSDEDKTAFKAAVAEMK